MADYNFTLDIPTRFRDIDAMQHVNNAVYASYIEDARVKYVEEVVGKPLTELGAVIANLEIEFNRPIEYGETVTVAVRTGELGHSSIPVEHEIRVEDTVAATAEVVMLPFDPAAGEARPIPDEWREAFDEFEGRA